MDEGYESITIKKVNPFQRELKYFVRINQDKMDKLAGLVDSRNVELDK